MFKRQWPLQPASSVPTLLHRTDALDEGGPGWVGLDAAEGELAAAEHLVEKGRDLLVVAGNEVVRWHPTQPRNVLVVERPPVLLYARTILGGVNQMGYGWHWII